MHFVRPYAASPVLWYLARARGPQVVHARFSAVDGLLVPFLLSVATDSLLWWQQQQKIQFRTNILQEEVKSLLLCPINYDNSLSELVRSGEVYLHQICLSGNRYRTCLMSVSCSCSQIVSLQMLLVANEFLTHSYFGHECLYNAMKSTKLVDGNSLIVFHFIAGTCTTRVYSRKHEKCHVLCFFSTIQTPSGRILIWRSCVYLLKLFVFFFKIMYQSTSFWVESSLSHEVASSLLLLSL